jgi:hypothetical protein
LAETAGAGGELANIRQTSSHDHAVQAVGWLQGAEQDRRARAGSADQVQAPVQTVGAIDIGSANRAEHRRVALRGTRKGVRSRVVNVVRFCLDHDAADPVEGQQGADQAARHHRRGVVEIDHAI